ncbi:transglutaminase-like domain-containing protein [Priestia endophytica]|uniref:transglutaminase-like domain-containing protein n=1 Tax=Priestia endophytica TaxID=135735 RepID=UPI00227EB2C8|nr:transglutaminase family protein [Priestia endophytica]MCY8233486.1 transglutaminase family protein [Priestia endophytica]
MGLVLQSTNPHDYLISTPEVNFTHPSLMKKADEIYANSTDKLHYAKEAYEFVRDHIAHSWDIRSHRVTRTASEVLAYGEGICYAKSNLLAALLRVKGIPTGFCYQRLTLFDTPEDGYCIHALNAVYIDAENKWIRLDSRGNKPGVNAQFSLYEEKLAFPVRPHLDELDYPTIYVHPHEKTMNILKEHSDGREIYMNGLPKNI